jgi:hypothetical protein
LTGVSAAAGSRVRRLKVGDEVYAYNWQNPKGGFCAEYVVVPVDKAAPIRKRLDLQHAGAIPITGLTALQGIDDAPGLKKPRPSSFMVPQEAWERLPCNLSGFAVREYLRRHLARKAWNWCEKWAAHMVVDGRRPDLDDQTRRFAPDAVDAVAGVGPRRRAGAMPECAAARCRTPRTTSSPRRGNGAASS